MDIKLEIAREGELWDSIVDGSPNSTIFHKWSWLDIAKRYSKCRLYPLIGYNGTTPVGCYPLFFQKKGFLRMVFSPPPHCAILYLGPVIANYEKLKQSKLESISTGFQRSVDQFIFSALNANYVSVSTSPGIADSRPLKWTGYDVRPMYSYLLDLKKGKDHLWRQFTKNLRQSIDKTKRGGVLVEEGSRSDLEKIHDLLTGRYKSQNRIVTVPKEYLLDLYREFPENIKIFVAKLDGEIRTGEIDIFYKDRVTTWIGSPKTELMGIYPNDLLFWETLQEGCEKGFDRYEIIGAAGSERLYSYYSKCNPELILWFSATKYSSFLPRLLETGYIRILKPAYSKLKLRGEKWQLS